MKLQSPKIIACGLALTSLAQAEEPAQIPSGFLSASKTLVREGLPVQLTWSVTVPKIDLEEIVPKDPDKDITPTVDVVAEVRVLGAALGASDNPMWAEAKMTSTTTGQEVVIFDGYADGVGAGTSETFVVDAGDKLEFESVTWNRSNLLKGYDRDDWIMRTPVYTGTGDDRLFLLTDGEEVPWYDPAADQADINAFLGPYLHDDGKTLNLGPRDLLILTELNNKVTSIADFQDMVVLITFTEVESQ